MEDEEGSTEDEEAEGAGLMEKRDVRDGKEGLV